MTEIAAGGVPRRVPAAGPGRRPVERSQAVWRRALELAATPGAFDRHVVTPDLLAVARQSRSTLVHALALGRARQRARPADPACSNAVRLLARTVGWLGLPDDEDEVGTTRPDG